MRDLRLEVKRGLDYLNDRKEDETHDLQLGDDTHLFNFEVFAYDVIGQEDDVYAVYYD